MQRRISTQLDPEIEAKGWDIIRSRIEITLKDGRVQQSDFGDYRMLRLREMPAIEVVLAPSGGFWGGVGEAGGAAVAPAVVNALFASSGQRVRALPLRNAGFDLA